MSGERPAPVDQPVSVGFRHLRIFHPTDLSCESDLAFAHALKLAVVTGGELHIMHVDPEMPETDWSDLPGVRATLARWGALPEGSSREDVAKLGLRVEKILGYAEDPERSVVRYLERHRPDLMVLATHAHEGWDHWFSKSLAQSWARTLRIPTLFVPTGAAGFVDPATGRVALRHVLIPVHQTPPPQPAIEAAAALAASLSIPIARWTLLHVGSGTEWPSFRTVDQPGWTWNRMTRSGDVTEEIVAQCREGVDAVVMATEWRQGLLDALLGSTTERVLHLARLPLLAIPSQE
ncbi:universal stress protein [Candidatus Nitrospira bockiana]